MATVLLVGAGLLTSSFVRLSRNNKGYDAANVVALKRVHRYRGLRVRRRGHPVRLPS